MSNQSHRPWRLLKFPCDFFVTDVVATVQYFPYLQSFSYHLASDKARKLNQSQLFSLQIASRARRPNEARSLSVCPEKRTAWEREVIKAQ